MIVFRLDEIFDQKVLEEIANKACFKTLAMATHTFKVLLDF
jgi:ABC-type transport system involved in cytochrome bd biosynthesis fused ATPase/permease subunit